MEGGMAAPRLSPARLPLVSTPGTPEPCLEGRGEARPLPREVVSGLYAFATSLRSLRGLCSGFRGAEHRAPPTRLRLLGQLRHPFRPPSRPTSVEPLARVSGYAAPWSRLPADRLPTPSPSASPALCVSGFPSVGPALSPLPVCPSRLCPATH